MHIRKNNNNNQRNREDYRNDNNQIIEIFNKIKCYSCDEKEHKLNDLMCFKYVEYQKKRNRCEKKMKKVQVWCSLS